MNGTFTEQDWITNFRLSQSTFDYLCHELKNEIVKKDTVMRLCIPIKMKVAIALWFLATNADYRTIGHLFGVSKASVCLIRREVCRAIVSILLPKYIKVPVGSGLTDVIRGFEKRGFPHCGGAIDGSHIPIEAPQNNPADYYNRKGWHSVVLQGMVDHVGAFTDICVGWPGRVHDARVFHNSGVFLKGERGDLFEDRLAIMNNVRVPVIVLGDPAYPLLPWLMKPFINSGSLTPEQLEFNNRLSKARVIVEHAFGRLKGRWRCLRKKLSVQLEDVPDIVASCCVLHNICQIHGDNFDESWLDPTDMVSITTSTHSCVHASNSDGNNIRRAVMEYIYYH